MKIRQRFGDLVAFRFHYLPKRGSAMGRRALEAVACAEEQGRGEAYLLCLLIHHDELERRTLDGYARELRLEGGAFAACLDSGRHAGAADREKGRARCRGVARAPALHLDGGEVLAPAWPDDPLLMGRIEERLWERGRIPPDSALDWSFEVGCNAGHPSRRREP
jgi:hypothetical protein